MSSEGEKSSPWVAVLAGAVVLGTVPLGFALMSLLWSRLSDTGQTSYAAIAELFAEGGRFSNRLLLAAILSSLASATLVTASVRKPGLPAPIALFPFLLVSLTALLGLNFGLREVLALTASAAPSDKGIILVGTCAELLSLSVQALAFAAAGTLCVTLASVVSLGAAPRGPRILTLIGAGSLGACLVAMTAQQLALRIGLSNAVRSSPVDRFPLFWHAFDGWRLFIRPANGLFFASVGVALVGGAVLVARNQRVAGIGTAAMLVVAAIGFRGFHSLGERQVFSEINALPAQRLRPLKGIEPSRSENLELSGPTTVDAAVSARLSKHDIRDQPPRALGVQLTSALQPRTLLRFLQVAHVQRVTWVELIGEAPREKHEVPALFAGLVAAMQLQLAAPVRVRFTDEACVHCAEGTLTKSGLEVDGVEWRPLDEPFIGTLEELLGVEVPWTDDLEALVRASLAALSHQRVLVVRVPRPDSVDPRAGE